MNKRLFLLLWLPCLALASNAKDYFGYWKTTAVADYGNGDVIANEKADKRVGGYLILSSWRVSFDGHHFTPEYRLSEVDPVTDLEAGFKVTDETLKLPDPVLAIDAGCAYLYALDEDHIVFESNGVFYRAIRQNMLKIRKKPENPVNPQ